MKKFFRKLGFRKMDEMELLISFKAQRVALIYVIITLFLWTLYESYKVYIYHTNLNPFPCFLLVTTTLVQNLAKFIITKRTTKGVDEADDTSNIASIIVLVISLALVLIGGIITLGTIG